jgi:hypothetical protein
MEMIRNNRIVNVSMHVSKARSSTGQFVRPVCASHNKCRSHDIAEEWLKLTINTNNPWPYNNVPNEGWCFTFIFNLGFLNVNLLFTQIKKFDIENKMWLFDWERRWIFRRFVLRMNDESLKRDKYSNAFVT